MAIGGSKNFNTVNMQVANRVCGHSEEIGPELPVFCEMTTVRLVSHGHHNNQLILTVRNAEANDITSEALICPSETP